MTVSKFFFRKTKLWWWFIKSRPWMFSLQPIKLIPLIIWFYIALRENFALLLSILKYCKRWMLSKLKQPRKHKLRGLPFFFNKNIIRELPPTNIKKSSRFQTYFMSFSWTYLDNMIVVAAFICAVCLWQCSIFV